MESHIPVMPNLNRTTKKNIFEDAANDADVQRVVNNKKKIDVLELDHNPTKEELESKNSNDGMSWIVIILAFIVVILVMVIVWYVLKNNEDRNKIVNLTNNAIHPSVLQPGQQQGSQGVQQQGVTQQRINNNQTTQIKKQNYQEPNPAELNEYLQKLSKSNNDEVELSEQPTDHKEATLQSSPLLYEQEIDTELQNNEPLATIPEEEIDINDDIKNLILNDDFDNDENDGLDSLNPDEMDKFHSQILSSA